MLSKEEERNELVALGYKNVKEFKEGKMGWMAAGYKLEGTNPDEPFPPAPPGQAQAASLNPR
ncbi:MAG TPA: hypothetical protein V6D17_07270 [Candidatus Obscuribacterales bacterium]